jgi:hypothetical protein
LAASSDNPRPTGGGHISWTSCRGPVSDLPRNAAYDQEQGDDAEADHRSDDRQVRRCLGHCERAPVQCRAPRVLSPSLDCLTQVRQSARAPRAAATLDAQVEELSMAFVTSRGFYLPESPEQMAADVWFSLWRNRLWPYDELREGEDLYWYETPSKRIVWRSRVAQVNAFPYESLDAAVDRIDDAFGIETDTEQLYLQGKPQVGYCLAYRVEALKRLDLPKPDDVRCNQQGWERGSRPEIAAWLGQTPPVEAETPGNPDWARDEIVLALDLFVRGGSLGGNQLPGKTDPDVVALSEQMARLPIHPLRRRGPGFRNATGVALKLANFRAIDRDVAIERGESGAEGMPKGMTRYSALDRSIFEEFYGAWDNLREEAQAIRAEASPAPDQATRPTVESRPIEDSRTETFDAAPTSGGIRTRREAILVRRYADWMEERGFSVERQQYSVEGEARPLVCDVFLPELSLLVEAKAHDNRNSMRLAIGQLMDYRRFVDKPRLAILLPHEPAPDHRDLLRSVDVAWIWPDRRGRFRDSLDGEITGL